MGAVYEAKHKGTNRKVAIKVINSGDVNKDQKLVGRFQREAKAAGSIDTQHITQVLDTGVDRDSGLPFMVMEYLAGEDLQALFKRLGPVSPELALRLVAQTCLGLQKAHEAQVVHRDIKPANLFLTERDGGELIVKLLDFGIAKVKMDQANETESAGLTKTGSMVGSPLYMSPEQALGAKTIDHRTDVFSLGVVLYQALTGRTPFQHIDALGQLIISICHDSPPPVHAFAPWVTPEVEQIVEAALNRDPNGRFQTAHAMLEAVRSQIPGGSWTITRDMIAPISPEIRATIISMRPPPMGGTTTGAGARTALGGSGSGTRVNTGTGTTEGAILDSQAAPRRSTLPIMLALAAIGAAGIAVYVATARAPKSQPAAEVVAAKVAPPPTASAAPLVEPAASSTPTTRTVQLVVEPKDAKVEVDGVAAIATDGIVDIKGTLGSVHNVHLAKGASEDTGQVVVTDSGASPPKIELVVAAAAPAKGGAKAAPSATPVAKPATPGIATEFN
jgi:serine/threonine-protein kinase